MHHASPSDTAAHHRSLCYDTHHWQMCGDVRLHRRVESVPHPRGVEPRDDFEAWKLGGRTTNSFILRVHSADVTFLLSDNDPQLGTSVTHEPCCPKENATTTLQLWEQRGCRLEDAVQCWHHDRVASTLDALGFVPDVVLIATVNFEREEVHQARVRCVPPTTTTFHRTSPSATYHLRCHHHYDHHNHLSPSS